MSLAQHLILRDERAGRGSRRLASPLLRLGHRGEVVGTRMTTSRSLLCRLSWRRCPRQVVTSLLFLLELIPTWSWMMFWPSILKLDIWQRYCRLVSLPCLPFSLSTFSLLRPSFVTCSPSFFHSFLLLFCLSVRTSFFFNFSLSSPLFFYLFLLPSNLHCFSTHLIISTQPCVGSQSAQTSHQWSCT